jgi:hypothetical protein
MAQTSTLTAPGATPRASALAEKKVIAAAAAPPKARPSMGFAALARRWQQEVKDYNDDTIDYSDKRR